MRKWLSFHKKEKKTKKKKKCIAVKILQTLRFFLTSDMATKPFEKSTCQYIYIKVKSNHYKQHGQIWSNQIHFIQERRKNFS